MKSIVSIDEFKFEYDIEGEFSWGEQFCFVDENKDKLSSLSWFKNGFSVKNFLTASELVELKLSVSRNLMGIFKDIGISVGTNLDLGEYHKYASNKEVHQQIIQRTRELRFADLAFNGEWFCGRVSSLIGIPLSPVIKELGRDHVQLRINRPNSLDINPPHRDGYLNIWKNVINLWLPIVGCNEKSILPLIEGSHYWTEDTILKTNLGGARIDGNSYRVPAILDTKYGLKMKRPLIKECEILMFTPYLIHGAAVNQNLDTTRMALEFRLEIKDQGY